MVLRERSVYISLSCVSSGFTTTNITPQCGCGDGPKSVEIVCTACDHKQCGSCTSQTVKIPVYR